MSGGYYNYQYRAIQDLAVAIVGSTPLRKAFKKHLTLVSDACHDIEWVDSCDYGKGDEDAAILACLGDDAGAKVLAEVAGRAEKVLAELKTALANAQVER